MRSSVSLFLMLSLAVGSGQGMAAAWCAAPGKDGPAYQPNTYYAGSGSAPSGGKAVTLGAMRSDANASSAPIQAGDQVFIIQMQDASINNSNSVQYGDGSSGRGYTAINNAGKYEFAVVSSVSSGNLTLRDPLINTYTAQGASATATRKSFQVIRVPQHSSLTLSSSITTPAWNGFTGGVTVLDVAGTLNLGGQTINADYAGFRGGGSFQNGVLTGQNVTDYANVWAGIGGTSRGAMKGEGYAGTPSMVRRLSSDTAYTGITAGLASGDQGYPAGYVVARGAPGNAGGGGTQHNAGGGGGGNAGEGGKGGKSWIGDGGRDVNGLGGVSLTPTSTALIAGGGGGAGDANDFANPYTNAGLTVPIPLSSGGNGGGIIFVRAGTLTGSGTFSANGQDGGPSGWDAAGGGGAGGTVAVVASTSTASLTIQAHGGKGGNTGAVPQGQNYGPGGGGGGGAVLLSPAVSATSDLAGGLNGQNTPQDTAYLANAGAFGSTPGGSGSSSNAAFNGDGNTAYPTACYPQLTVTKTTSTPTRILRETGSDTQASYTIKVSNAAGRGDALGVTVSDPALPGSMTYASTSALTLSGAATRPSTSDPTSGSTAPAWSIFTLPGGSSVEIAFVANLNGTPPGTYQNAANATYLDPARTTSNGTATASYNASSSTAEDVNVVGVPKVVLEKWVRNVTRGETFGKTNVGLPGEILEYCVNFRETLGSGFNANNFVLKDLIPANTDALPDAYEPGKGVRLASNSLVAAGSSQPSGTNLTSVSTDSDGAALSQAAGLEYKTNLSGGSKGSVCFQVKMR